MISSKFRYYLTFPRETKSKRIAKRCLENEIGTHRKRRSENENRLHQYKNGVIIFFMEITINERKKLYKACFQDSDVYTDGFFKQFYNGNNATDIVKDGVLAATMYTKTHFLCLGLKVLPYEFITGLGVHPDYRNQGLATKLLTKYLRSSNAAFAALHPFDRNFYKKQGFVPYSYASEDTCKATRSVLVSEPIKNFERIRIFVESARKKSMESTFPFPPVLQSIEDKLNEIRLELDDGAEFQSLFSAIDECFEGYTVVKDKEILFYEIFDEFHLNDVEAYKGYRFYHTPLSNTVYNMARAINVERLLYLIPYSVDAKTQFDFVLEDDKIPKNNGVYRVVIENGNCIGVIRRQNSYGLPVITAEELTRLALGQPNTVKGDASLLRPYFLVYRIKDLSQY